jgi:hypothetical protein
MLFMQYSRVTTVCGRTDYCDCLIWSEVNCLLFSLWTRQPRRESAARLTLVDHSAVQHTIAQQSTFLCVLPWLLPVGDLYPTRDKTDSKHGARPDYRELESVHQGYHCTPLTRYAHPQTTNKLQDVFSEIGGDLDLPMVSLAVDG